MSKRKLMVIGISILLFVLYSLLFQGYLNLDKEIGGFIYLPLSVLLIGIGTYIYEDDNIDIKKKLERRNQFWCSFVGSIFITISWIIIQDNFVGLFVSVVITFVFITIYKSSFFIRKKILSEIESTLNLNGYSLTTTPKKAYIVVTTENDCSSDVNGMEILFKSYSLDVVYDWAKNTSLDK